MLPRLSVIFLPLANLILGVSATSWLAVTGVQGASGDGSVPLRRSITDLQAEAGPQWDLYIQALTSMYQTDSSDAESFFQIAGIHGRPFVEYNGTGAMYTDGWGGYSTHGENLFLIWHRPFIVLFEQTLVKTAKKLAAAYPGQFRDIYTKAAEDLRAPYWDWALEPHVPQATVPNTIQINVATATGIQKAGIANPLYTYNFPQPARQGRYGAFDQKNDRTYRCTSPKSYPSSANQNLASRNYKGALYDAFSRARYFSDFATTASGGSSLEALHNSVHWDAGCGGQFLDAQYSAFEPLFMLHHSNMDRLWAYWQALRPDSSTFSYNYQGYPRFSTPSRTSITPSSPLQPFVQENTHWHTVQTVNSIKSFGYSYKGLEYWTKTEDQMKQSTIQIINSLYRPNNYGGRRRDTSITNVTATGVHMRLFASISLDVSELSERPCSVEVSVGGRRAGGMVIMRMPAYGVIHDAFALEEAVKSAGLYQLYPLDQLVSEILSRLEVNIVKPDGSRLDAASVPSLKVDIEETHVVPPSHDFEFPGFALAGVHEGFLGGVKGCPA